MGRQLSAKHKRLRKQLAHPGMPCADCGRPVTMHDPKLDTHAELDHIIPVKYGGKDERSNVRITCRRCNRSRGAKPLRREPKTSQSW